MAVRDRLGPMYAGDDPGYRPRLTWVRSVCLGRDCMRQEFTGEGNDRVEDILRFINSDYIDPTKMWITVEDCKLVLAHCEAERKRLSSEVSEILSEGWDR